MRRRILVMAYMLSPYKGSEFSVAWNYVTHMSKANDLTVLYGISGNHMGECRETEDYIDKHPIPGVELIPVYPNHWANLLNWPNRHDIFVYTFYFAYRAWHRQAYRIACQLAERKHFDIVHYVGMIGYREPGYLWKLDLPYVWGPVGGANNVPWQLMKHMPLTGKIKSAFRNIANTIQLHTMRRLRKALKSTDVLMTATSENQRKFKGIYNKDSICLPENCITGSISLDEAKFENPSKYNIMVIGRLDANKSVGTLLEALTKVSRRDMLHVDIVGDGPLRGRLQHYASRHGLEGLMTWHGQLPRQQAVQLFNSAHLHVITSVSEGNPTTIWEAMSYGVPTLSFDHCGMHDTLCGRCGIRVPIAKHYEKCVDALARAIDDLLEHPARFRQLAEGTIQCAKRYTWDEREKFLNSLYDDMLMYKSGKWSINESGRTDT